MATLGVKVKFNDLVFPLARLSRPLLDVASCQRWLSKCNSFVLIGKATWSSNSLNHIRSLQLTRSICLCNLIVVWRFGLFQERVVYLWILRLRGLVCGVRFRFPAANNRRYLLLVMVQTLIIFLLLFFEVFKVLMGTRFWVLQLLRIMKLKQTFLFVIELIGVLLIIGRIIFLKSFLQYLLSIAWIDCP